MGLDWRCLLLLALALVVGRRSSERKLRWAAAPLVKNALQRLGFALNLISLWRNDLEFVKTGLGQTHEENSKQEGVSSHSTGSARSNRRQQGWQSGSDFELGKDDRAGAGGDKAVRYLYCELHNNWPFFCI
jgi:hypothetical protein